MIESRRQRFVAAVVLVAAALAGNAYADYRLILRNPAELEEIARDVLARLFPDYSPTMAAPEVFIAERRALIRDLVFHEREGGRTLFRVAAVEVGFTLLPPAVRSIAFVEPQGTIRIDREGRINFDTGGDVGGSTPTLPGALELSVRDGWLRVVSELEGERRDVLLTDVAVEALVRPDLSLEGRGAARLGALFTPEDPRGWGVSTDARGLPPELRFRPLFPALGFAVRRDGAGRLDAEVDVEGELSPALRSMIPALFQQAVWDELDPGGPFEGRVRLGLEAEDGDPERLGLRVAATVLPRGASIRPRGFPMLLREIEGRFEVGVHVPLGPGGGAPDFLAVTWDGVRARAGATGTTVSRGAVYPGGPNDFVSLFVSVEARDMALDEDLVRALPPDIRAVYQRFSPEGSIPRARVTIFKGPHLEEPRLSVQIDELQGAITAAYEDYPIRLHEVRGRVDILEDANVEIHAGGKLALGGDARVDAHVVRGELLHVRVRGEGVPVGPELVATLSPGVRDLVADFDPRGGLVDFDVAVSKPHRDALAVPRVEVGLRGVTIRHVVAPVPLTTTGRVVLEPRFPTGARPEDDPSPELVDVALDVAAWAPGVEGVRAAGPLVVRPTGGPFEGDLAVTAASVELDERLRAALPAALQAVWAQVGPTGKLRDVTARVGSPSRFEATARGDGLGATLEALPWPLAVERISLARDGRRLTLREVVARPAGAAPPGAEAPPGDGPPRDGPPRDGPPADGPAGEGPAGRLEARGLVVEVDDGPPLVDVSVGARGVPLDAAFVAALPAGPAREQLEALAPSGPVDADLRVTAGAGLPARVEGKVALRGVRAEVHRLHPSLAGLEGEPARDLRGELRLELPERVEVLGLAGALLGARLAVAGVVDAAPGAPGEAAPGPPEDGAAPGPPAGEGAAAADAPARVHLGVHLAGLVLDDATRARLAPGAGEALELLDPRGPVDVEALVRLGPDDPRVTLRLRPRGLTVVPSFFPMPVSDLEGEVELEGGEPVRLDVRGRAGDAVVVVRRDAAREGRFPEAGARGRVFEVRVTGFGRAADPRARAELERRLPERLRGLLTRLTPEGPLDAHAFLYQPLDAREPLRWVAEVRPGGLAGAFALSAGLRFEGIRGLLRLSGRVAELERGAFEGEVELEQLAWSKQTARRLRGRLRLADGVLSFGLPRAPVVGELYGGTLKVVAQLEVATGRYRGWVGVEQARLDRCMEELALLRDEPAAGGGARQPYTGLLDAALGFHGGGRGLGDREAPLDGAGWLHLSGANLLEIPATDWLRVISNALNKEVTKPFAFETLHVDFGLRPRGIDLDGVELSSPRSPIRLVGTRGTLDFDGDVSVDLVPFDTGSTVWQRVFENAPFTGFPIRGKVWSPVVPYLPLYGPIERMLRTIAGGEDEREGQAEGEGRGP